MKLNALRLLTLLLVVAAMSTLTRCGSGVGKTVSANVGAVKF
jgi:hypothetical protein